MFLCLTLPDLLVLQHVVRLEGDVMHAEDLDHRVGEAAPWLLGDALHEDDYVGLLDQGCQAGLDVGGL